MLAENRVIAVIPARGGSKSVPKKNIKPLAGEPLLAWSVAVAQKVPAVDRVIVSTDDDEIASVARECGAEVYRRPPELAGDASLVIDALRDLTKRLEAEGEEAVIEVLLEPTCPFRSAEDVTQCLELIAGGCDSAATFVEARLHPHRAWRITGETPEVFVSGAVPWLPRQALPRAYQLNGAVYAFRAAGLKQSGRALLFGKQGAVIMPAARSVDIDTELDFRIAEAMLEETHA